MKPTKLAILSLMAVLSLLALGRQAGAQSKTYQQMTEAERSAFVAEQARIIASRLAGTTYQFTPSFEAEIQREVNAYARRVGNNQGDLLWKGDAKFVYERGRSNAPTLIGAFKSRNISPLIGLYIPFIESEYVNIQKPNGMGARGMFQFLPGTGKRYGLSIDDLMDTPKSADAAARYIAESLDQFKDDPMKEALAILSYNSGQQKIAAALAQFVNEQNKQCSICALTDARSSLDQTFQSENVYYVPRFFGAAIVGENPAVFGLEGKPLSSYETAQ